MGIFVIILSVIMGAMLIIIKSFNMLLGQHIGIYSSNLVNHITGVIGSGAIYLLVLATGLLKWMPYGEIPSYLLLGGVIGSIFVVLSNYSFSKTSVVASTILILCGQFISSLFIDIYLLKIQVKSTSIAGAALIIIGTVLYNLKGRESKAAADI